MQMLSPSSLARFLGALEADAEFGFETRWFDGSILLQRDMESLWIKVYRGKAIDSLEFVPVFGYTFKLAGSAAAWDKLGRGERTFTDLVSAGSRHCATIGEIEEGGVGYRPPEIAIEGNGIEAGRMHIATRLLARHFAEAIVATTEPVA